MEENIQKLIEKTISIVNGVQEPYNKIAFEVILKHLLETNSPFQSKSNKVLKSKVSSSASAGDRLQQILQSDYDWSAWNFPKLSPIGQYLCVLKVVKSEFNSPGLSISEIQNILIQKFRIQKTINAIGMSLMDVVGNHVDRLRQDKEFSYRITTQGEIHLQDLLEKIGGKK